MSPDAQRWIFDTTVWLVGLVMALMLAAEAAAGERRLLLQSNDAWKSECGSCHVAYPPHLLSAQSWRMIMNDLGRHFGVDASIDVGTTAAAIGTFLEANAAPERGKHSDPATLRITETRWFRHEHGEITTATWAGPKVGSAANCGACHGGAANGEFSERNVRVPR
jgi:cytochrome c553